MKYVIVIEQGKRSSTVGPYSNSKVAERQASEWGGDGRRAWVEPVLTPAEFSKTMNTKRAEVE